MAELTQVHKPVNATGMPRIVFIHGLDGHFRESWMSDPKNDLTLWPKWLGEDTQCPVWLLGYGAALSRWTSDAMALPRQAGAILECLASEPALMDGPLVLVGHSLGGLIIKTILKQGMGRDVERHKRLVNNIKGIAFVGTPHFGSKFASLATKLHLLRANPQVKELALDDAYLEELNQLFLSLQRDLSIRSRVYSETQPMRLPRPWHWIPVGLLVVSASSSQPHIPGEAGTPVEGDHRSICKPTHRRAALYISMKAFIHEFQEEALLQASKVVSKPRAIPSERFEARTAEEKSDTHVHLALSTYGYSTERPSAEPVSGTLCLVTDDPDRLRKTLECVRAAIAADPLVPTEVKKNLIKASLCEIVQTPSARVAAMRQLSTTSFSAYLYYCRKAEFDVMTDERRMELLLIRPLLHRFSKKSQRVDQIHSKLPNVLDLVAGARKEVTNRYRRDTPSPIVGAAKFAPLEEIASFVIAVACDHLANPNSAAATEVFESLRTRIRYAENVATNEKHLRDENPLQ